MYLILCWSYLNHSLRFVGGKKRIKKKSHIKSQSQYFGKKSQLDYFPKSFSPSVVWTAFLQTWVFVCHAGLVCPSMRQLSTGEKGEREGEMGEGGRDSVREGRTRQTKRGGVGEGKKRDRERDRVH